MPGRALLSSMGCCPVNPQVPTEDGDRKPVGGTKMDKDLLARTMQQLRSGVIHKQVVSGREFKGRPFNSKPEVVHFKVRPLGSWVAEGGVTAPGVVAHGGQGHSAGVMGHRGQGHSTKPHFCCWGAPLLSCEGQ